MIRLLALLALIQFCALAGTPTADFDAANRLYEKGDYAGAVAAYGKLMESGKTRCRH